MSLVSHKMLYLCTLPNTRSGSERRDLSEFRERWEPALWVTLWAETQAALTELKMKPRSQEATLVQLEPTSGKRATTP